ncbi:MAG TPA: ATP-binding protein [Planctomycetota bacterium]|nr:ATP-binding protein [Planctomycetota bacterium]
MKAVRQRGLVLLAAGLALLLTWAVAPRPSGSAEDELRAGEAYLRERFGEWRGRVERASRRLAALPEAPLRDDFEAAARIVDEERIDGVAIVDMDNRARVWAGRTFDADPALDFFGVAPGVDAVRVLDVPAHRVLFAARAAPGGAIAVAYLAFDERFPSPRDLAREVARAAHLAEVQLRFRSEPPHAAEDAARPRLTVVLDDNLVRATLVARSGAERDAAAAKARGRRLRIALALAAVMLAFGAWRGALRAMDEGARRTLVGLGLLAALRALLAMGQPVWGDPVDTLLTGLAALLAGFLVVRWAEREMSRRTAALLAGPLLVACALLPRGYALLVARLVEGDVVLFDPVRVLPDRDAALLLAGLCLLTCALFLAIRAAVLLARRARPLLALLPYLAVAAGLLPLWGPAIALLAFIAGHNLVRVATRPEKAAGMAVLAALASFPLLYEAQQADFAHEVGERMGALVRHDQREEAAREIDEAVGRILDPAEGVEGTVAYALAMREGLQHLAFRIWSAAGWDVTEPCALQVWDADGRLVSAFDFDSPPVLWLPKGERGSESVFQGEGRGEAIRFYARDFEFRTSGTDQLVGKARLSVPDRWDVLLLSAKRPSLFSEPLDLGVPDTPILIAELGPDGKPLRSSASTTAEITPPPLALQAEARQKGYATERTTWRDSDARMVLAAGKYDFGEALFEEDFLVQASFVFSKILLTYSGVLLLYALGILALRRGRVTLLFRHRVALVLVLLSMPPVVLLAIHGWRQIGERHRVAVDERLARRLDLAETLLQGRKEPVDDEWCMRLASEHLVDINVYRGGGLMATSRPGLWDTGLVSRRLAADAYVALVLLDRDDDVQSEFFGHSATLRTAYRKVRADWDGTDIILGAPALEDRRALERQVAASVALLLAIFFATALVTVFIALLLARSLTRPVVVLREATSRVAAGELDASLPETRRDEFGDLIRAFNRMTRELIDAQDLRARAEKAAAWQAVARQVAHEIKNPLTPIKLTVQNLLAAYREDPDVFAAEFERGGRLILDQIDALQRIAGAFHAYATFPTKQTRPVDVGALVRDVGDLYAAAGGSAVQVEAPSPPLIVRADRDELRRALINLVTNARQAGAMHVLLRAVREDGLARIDVLDDGAGIPPELHDRIFDPAFTTKAAGAGLGLPIVKRIVTDYQGHIEVESAPGRGTRFTIRLPAVE